MTEFSVTFDDEDYVWLLDATADAGESWDERIEALALTAEQNPEDRNELARLVDTRNRIEKIQQKIMEGWLAAKSERDS